MNKNQEKLIYEYLTSNLNVEQESDEYIDAMLSISSTTASLGSEVNALMSSLNTIQQHRLNSLKKELKNGLTEYEKPFGSLSRDKVSTNFLYYQPKDLQIKNIEAFLIKLESIEKLEDEKKQSITLRELKVTIEEFKTKGINLKNYITTQSQKKIWNRLVLRDPNKMDKFELDDILLKMKLAITKHSKKLKEISDYFNSLDKVEEDFATVTSSYIERDKYIKVIEKYKFDKAILVKPDAKELVTEVAKIKEQLENKLERLPESLNEEQKVIVSDFLPMLREYYEDQCAAFVGGKKYLPMARDLQEFHDSIESLYVTEFLDKSDKLGYTMQHLFLLHWVGEELMKKFDNKDLTLGRSINKRQEIHKRKQKHLFTRYVKFMDGVLFRNNVAHNGILWEPNGFEDAINRYKKGIVLLGDDFSKDLSKVYVPKRQVQKFSKKEEEDIKKEQENLKQHKFCEEYFGTTIEQVKESLKHYNTALERISEEQVESNDRPAFNTFYYLYKKHEDGEDFDAKNEAQLEKIKKILKEN